MVAVASKKQHINTPVFVSVIVAVPVILSFVLSLLVFISSFGFCASRCGLCFGLACISVNKSLVFGNSICGEPRYHRNPQTTFEKLFFFMV